MNKKEADMMYFANEVSEFLQFAIHLCDSVDENYSHQLDMLNTSKKMADFYEKNKYRYNDSQIVHQFIKQLNGGKFDKLYNKYKSARKKHGPFTRWVNE